MKTLVIIRFGTPALLQHEKPILDTIGAESRLGVVGGCGQIGYIAIFKTGFSPAEVVRMYDIAAQENQDTLPVLVFELDKMEANLKPMGFDRLLDAYVMAEAEAELQAEADSDLTEPDPEPEPTTKCTLSLDELLDLVSAKGVKGLSAEEHARLQELSK